MATPSEYGLNCRPKVSLIVPVYNVAPYLSKCLASLVNQTLGDIEIIVVNDFSPDDKDDEICQQFAGEDSRVRYIKHADNRKQGGARNTGISIARGDYVWFIDSDDFVDINACEFLYSQIRNSDVEVLAFSATEYEEPPKKFRIKRGYHYNQRHTDLFGSVYSGKDFMHAALDRSCFYVTCWTHLFERRFISQYRFREGVYREDTDFIPIAIRNAKSVHCISYAPYYRLIRQASATQQPFSETTLIDEFAYLHSLFQYIDKQGMDADDPLARFTSQQFQHVATLYESFRNKTEKIEQHFFELSRLRNRSTRTINQ